MRTKKGISSELDFVPGQQPPPKAWVRCDMDIRRAFVQSMVSVAAGDDGLPLRGFCRSKEEPALIR